MTIYYFRHEHVIEKNEIVKLVSNDGKHPVCQVLTHGEDEDD